MSRNNIQRGRRLAKRCYLIEPTPARVGGSVENTWSLMNDGKPIFCDITWPSRTQKESIVAGRETSVQEVRFMVRYRPDLTKVKVIYYRGQFFDIIALAELGRDQLQTLVTTWRDSDVLEVPGLPTA